MFLWGGLTLNRATQVGLVVIFSSTLAMTMQQAFELGYGIAAGIAIVGFGLNRENNNKKPRS